MSQSQLFKTISKFVYFAIAANIEPAMGQDPQGHKCHLDASMGLCT